MGHGEPGGEPTRRPAARPAPSAQRPRRARAVSPWNQARPPPPPAATPLDCAVDVLLARTPAAASGPAATLAAVRAGLAASLAAAGAHRAAAGVAAGGAVPLGVLLWALREPAVWVELPAWRGWLAPPPSPVGDVATPAVVPPPGAPCVALRVARAAGGAAGSLCHVTLLELAAPPAGAPLAAEFFTAAAGLPLGARRVPLKVASTSEVRQGWEGKECGKYQEEE